MKKITFSKATALAAALALLLGMAACSPAPSPTAAPTTAPATGSSTEAPPATLAPLEKVSLVYGMYLGYNSADDKAWPTLFIDGMSKKLNIELTVVDYNTDKQNLALASGDLPDLFMVNDPYVPQVVQGNLAVNLDDYLDEYAPNIKTYTQRNEFIRLLYSNGTGKLYFHMPHAGPDAPTAGTELWHGYLVRWDLYKQIGAPVMKNDDDYIAALKAMHDLYPQTENGDPVYGIGVHNDWGLWGWLIRSAVNMGQMTCPGWQFLQSVKTNDLINNYMDYQSNTPFWNDMTFYWKLNQAGLLDPDSFTMKNEEVGAKAAKGQYLGGYCTWMTDGFYGTMKNTDPNTLKGIIMVPYEGMNAWYNVDQYAGWLGKFTFVTTKCKNVERAVMFLDYQDSPEGNLLFYNGPQGTYWDVKDGKAAVTDQYMSEKSAGGDAWDKTGIQNGIWANVIGLAGSMTSPGGFPYDIAGNDRSILKAALTPLQKDYASFYGVDVPSDVILNMVRDGKAYDASTMDSYMASCMPPVPDDIKTIGTKCDEIVTKAIPKLVLAATQDDFNAARDQLISDLKAAGADTAWDWWSKNWQEAKAKLASIPK